MFIEDKPKFYGRRKGRPIRLAKATLIDSFLPKIKLTEINQDMFGITPKQIHLEIGFGDGQHIAGQALNNPDIGFIGAEVFQNGVANLCSIITGIKEGTDLPEEISIPDTRTDNIRVYDDDMRVLFSKIPDEFLDVVYLLFPDPWPKSRHAFRRFINKDNLDQVSRILKTGGILRVATDHKVYKAWTLRRMSEDSRFEWTAKTSADWRNEPKGWVKTKYQMKAIREGRKAVFLDYKKV